MKNKLFLILLTISVMVNAQNESGSKETESQKSMTEFSKKRRHNISLDVISGLVFPAFNPRYEYTINKYSTVGADLNINFDDNKGSEILEEFSFSPFYRQYFSSKEDYGAKGFYGEGFLKLYTYTYEIFEADYKTYFETAIGVGIGWKWISNTGFVIDISSGLGRNFGIANTPENEDREFTGKFGLNFGWQF